MMKTVRPTLAALALLLPFTQALADAGTCRYVPIAKLAVEFPGGPNQPIVNGAINGKPARMLVDTGADKTFLTREGAERLGLRLDQTRSHSFGVGGASVVYATRVDDFSVGIAHSGKSTMEVLGNVSVPGLDAIVGADFLLQSDMELSLADKYLQFFRPTGCDDTFLGYWDQNAMEIPFSGTARETNKSYVTVMLNGVKLQAMLDTGATRSVVRRAAAAKAGVRIDSPGVVKGDRIQGVGDAAIDRWFATFDSFSIGEETIKNAELPIMDDSPSGDTLQGADVLLGADFLRAHRILFAMSQRRLYLSYVGGRVFFPRPASPKP